MKLLLLSALTGLAVALPADSSATAAKYSPCGGLRGLKCPSKSQVCVDNPNTCAQAADCPGVCVTPRFCGGFAGIKCPKKQQCVDDTRDSCHPNAGGADCGGLYI